MPTPACASRTVPCDRGEAIALAERGRTEVLWGDRHVVLGKVGTASLEPRAALAISRGGQAKRYPYVDPNEDAVLAAAGPAGWLLAVADGHNGFDAARAALGAVERQAGRLLEQDGLDPTATVHELFGAARKAVVAALAGAGRSRQASRTALSIALVVGGQVYGASLGDTVALRLGQEFEEIGAEGPFLGPGSPLPRVYWAPFDDGDRLLVASDGLTDYLGPNWEERLRQAATATDLTAAARQLVLDAFSGGAGDNVAVGLLA
jgi:serine/threonine protein phosphatase PrpC